MRKLSRNREVGNEHEGEKVGGVIEQVVCLSHPQSPVGLSDFLLIVPSHWFGGSRAAA